MLHHYLYHCPSVLVRHRVQPMTPWFDAECRTTRRRVHAAERRFKHIYIETDRREWMVKCSELRALYELKNSAYWQNEIAACVDDSKKLWKVFHTVLGETCSVDTDLHTADEFAAFFSKTKWSLCVLPLTQRRCMTFRFGRLRRWSTSPQ